MKKQNLSLSAAGKLRTTQTAHINAHIVAAGTKSTVSLGMLDVYFLFSRSNEILIICTKFRMMCISNVVGNFMFLLLGCPICGIQAARHISLSGETLCVKRRCQSIE
jgi:hypothetical protein